MHVSDHWVTTLWPRATRGLVILNFTTLSFPWWGEGWEGCEDCWLLLTTMCWWEARAGLGGPRAVRGLDSTLSFYRGDWTGHARPAGRHTWILILRPGDHHTINHHHHNTFSFIYTSEWLCEECKVIAIKHFTAYHLGYSPSVSSYWMLTNDAGLFPIEISHQSAVTWNMKHSCNFLTLFPPWLRFS